MRRGLALALAAAVLAALAACGGGGATSGVSDAAAAREADAEVLEEILARQLGVVAAYGHALSTLDVRTLTLLRKFRAQEAEHADGVVQELRGLGAKATAVPEAIETGRLRTRAERLRFAYALESATIEAELTALAKLESATARTLLAATVANQAQHLTVLRRLLGARPVATVPTPFETGTTPAP